MVETRATKALRFIRVLLSITFSFVVFFDMQNYFLSAILEGLESCGQWWSRSYWYCFNLLLCFLICWQVLMSFLTQLYSLLCPFYATGVLEANFVEPAHDKQGFERTIVLSRLEQRLIKIQRKYWCVSSAIWIQKIRGNEQLNCWSELFFLGAQTARKLVMLQGDIQVFLQTKNL
jgi:hypothetical protein